MIKAVFLDFDGTLYSHSSGGVPSSTKEAIEKAERNGVKVVLCTGRLPRDIDRYNCRDIRFDGYIFLNGGLICDSNLETIVNNPVTPEVKEKLVNLFNKKHFPISLGTKDGIYLNYVTDFVIESLGTISSKPDETGTYNGEDIMFAGMFYTDEMNYHYIDDIRPQVNEFFWADKTSDVFSKNISKAIGIDYVLDHFQIDISETLCIGDGDNDIPMFDHCAISVAMGNSSEGLKKRADHVTSDIDDDGIANAFRHYSLI